jgi:hypothetical protein
MPHSPLLERRINDCHNINILKSVHWSKVDPLPAPSSVRFVRSWKCWELWTLCYCWEFIIKESFVWKLLSVPAKICFWYRTGKIFISALCFRPVDNKIFLWNNNLTYSKNIGLIPVGLPVKCYSRHGGMISRHGGILDHAPGAIIIVAPRCCKSLFIMWWHDCLSPLLNGLWDIRKHVQHLRIYIFLCLKFRWSA